MIRKLFIEGIILATVAFLIWFGFSQIDFMKVFRVKDNTTKLEKKVGNLIWENIQRTEDLVTEDSIVKTLDKLIIPICKANNIERDSLKIHIIDKDEVNAFALPDSHLVIYTGLINDCKNQQALQGVIGHEIAHITKNHVMKKLSKEIGFSVLATLVSGGGNNSGIMREILGTLSSSAYDRTLEKEADLTSVDYLVAAEIDPKPLADFMYQIAQENTLPAGFEWISSHPESEERARYIMEYVKTKKLKSKPTLNDQDWKAFKKKVTTYKEPEL